MVCVDCNFLSLMMHPGAKAPNDPLTDRPAKRMQDRMDALVEDLDSDEERIIIPMPVLAEFLILAGADGSAYLQQISLSKTFVLKPFDEKSAIELAAIDLADRARGDKRGGVKGEWQKIKIDRQIVAIAKVNGAHTMYADDKGVRSFAKKLGMKVVASWELYLPPSDAPLFDGVPELNAPPAQGEGQTKPLLMLRPPIPDTDRDPT